MRSQTLTGAVAILTVTLALCIALVSIQPSQQPVALLGRMARFQSLEHEDVPLESTDKYDAADAGWHNNEVEDIVIPADYYEALDDCEQDEECKAIKTDPVRFTNSERMPLFRLTGAACACLAYEDCPCAPPAEEEEEAAAE